MAGDQEAAPSDTSEEADILDLKDDEGWEDQEPDVEEIEVLCLCCSRIFANAQSMLLHCRDAHNIDIVKAQKTLSAYRLGEAIHLNCHLLIFVDIQSSNSSIWSR